MRCLGIIAATGATALAAAFIASPGQALARTAPAAADCAALASPGRIAGLAVSSAKPVDAAGGAPAFCEVTAVASPVPDSKIGVVFRLPYQWNGKLVGLGGGGWAGNVRLDAALPALRQGYAVLQTDGGHPSANSADASWSVKGPRQPNEAALTDFAWRAVHEMTASGKVAVRQFYGEPQTRAYFQGCSTGGRMGLMEAQRFPDDYDGIIAGAPVYDLLVQTSALMRTQFFHKDPESNLKPGQLPVINRAVLAACDKLDGAEDGIVSDPGACHWDPGVMQCPAGSPAADTCLSPKQVATVRNAYKGYTTRAGKVAAYPLMRGGELDWLGRSVGTTQAPLGSNALTGSRGIQYLVYADPDYDLNNWDPEKDLAGVRSSAYAKTYEAADPNISAFTKRGGKLILWHGGYDPGPSPLGTTAYYQAATKALGPAAADVRLFIVPGVYHCGGGPGPDQFDMISALDQWVEHGTAPASVLARTKDGKLSRPLCPYPEKAAYLGGDVNLAASFRCRR